MTKANHLPRVDAMRGVAALAVFTFHGFAWVFGTQTLENAQGLRRAAFGLNFGVTIFFIISGFLLFRPFALALWEGRPMPDVRAYAWRRFLRIVPAYWVVLTLVTVFSQRADPFPGGPLPYYGFVQVYDRDWAPWGIGPAWTLCVEVTFYLLLPVLTWLLVRLAGEDVRRRRRALVGALIGMAVVTVVWKVVVLASIEGRDRIQYQLWLPWHLDVFAIGMALTVLTLRRDSPAFEVVRSAGRRFTWGFLSVGLAAALLATFATRPDHMGTWDIAARQAFDTVCAAAVMAVVILAPRGTRLDRVLLWRPLVFLGTISYSFYLFHLAIISRVYERVHGALGPGPAVETLAFAVSFGLTVVVGAVGYYVIERPAMNLHWLVPDRGRALPDRKAVHPLAPPDRAVPDPHEVLPARQPI